ncbi:Phosphoenolpyruvate synthase [uncultured archaeon]|nr:Phosphoenolpyruvate synthase [uncultured archaeon]
MLEGKIASQGKVEARAFVTNNPGDIPPFEDYIIVTQNSNPEMSPLLYKSKGIITEVGGLMSHLAVVAREIQVPCITACDNCFKEIRIGYLLKINATGRLNSHVQIDYDI